MKYLIFLCVLVSCHSMAFASNGILVETSQGKLLGELSPRNHAIRVFKGIPYALPPTGNRRWKPSERHPGWSGVRQADTFGPDCMGLSTYIEHTKTTETSFFYHPPKLPSEDCLYLNVWTPSQGKNLPAKKLPVMVWIHSGGAVMGAGSWRVYDGTELASKDVIVVTFNYRLGIFGFFAHPELTAESPHHTSGNYGIIDQIQALEWVRDNIAAFGGDPENVTIFGQSFGSASVSILMASPLAKGFFHRAIGQSGANFGRLPELTDSRLGMPSAESEGLAFSKLIIKEKLPALREVSAVELFEASKKTYANLDKQSRIIIVDGWVLPQEPYDIFIQGKQHDIPVIVGFASDESYLGHPQAFVEYIKATKWVHGQRASAKLSICLDGSSSTAKYGGQGWAMEGWARMMEKVSSETYLYYFSHLPPATEGAYHGVDIAYVFNNEKYPDRFSSNMPALSPRKTDLVVADIMSEFWVSFAKNGIPAAKGLPEWKPYTNTAKHYMAFNGNALPSTNLFPGMWEIEEACFQDQRKAIPSSE